jgi:hypothetical protein
MAVRQRISANAIQALKDALVNAFWFKRDLYNYVKGAVEGEPTFLSGIEWVDPNVYKRDSVSTFVDRLVREQDDHQNLLLGLMVDVAAMTDFPQLHRTEDSEAKIAHARESVARLKLLIEPYEQTLAHEQAQRDQIAIARADAERRRGTAQRLSELLDRYVAIAQMPPQQRGYALEDLLKDLFDAFDLDPKASFRVSGDQVDGGFTLDEHYILEAKWENTPSARSALDVFSAKVGRTSENTLGLFLAMNGFEPAAVEAHCKKGSPLVLMDGGDLYVVLDGRIDLRELLRRKRRHAAMTGNILLTASELLRAS